LIQIREVVAHETALALAQLDERYPEMTEPPIATQRVKGEPEPTGSNILGNRHRNWMGTRRNPL
jgi:hypothetical protein